MASRTALIVAWSRSGSSPIAIQWVGVSPRGPFRCRSLRTMNWKVPTSDVSIAVMSTSPLPWPAWPSPASNSAPGTWTGMKSVVPATRSLLSRLPAWMPGGPLLMRPAASGGATPMLPKNGRSGISMLSRELGDVALQVERMTSSGALEILRGQHAALRAEAVVGVWNGDADLLDAHLQRVAGLGAFDIDGAGEDVAARAFVLHLGVDRFQLGLDLPA